MVKMIPLTIDHLKEVNERLNNVADNMIEMGQINCNEYSYAAVDGDRVLGCGGLLPWWPGMAEVWSLITDDLRRHPISLVKFAKFIVDNGAAKGGFHRVQAHVLFEDDRGCRFLEKLGFVNESPCFNYSSDKRTYWRYAKLF